MANCYSVRSVAVAPIAERPGSTQSSLDTGEFQNVKGALVGARKDDALFRAATGNAMAGNTAAIIREAIFPTSIVDCPRLQAKRLNSGGSRSCADRSRSPGSILQLREQLHFPGREMFLDLTEQVVVIAPAISGWGVFGNSG